jgi:hypothetical protein
MSISIKIPDQFYVGLKQQHKAESSLPLGFATPHEPGTKAYEKRKETVDRWANFNTRGTTPDSINPVIINNTPVAGFKIAESVRRVYWGGGNVVWRIVDPRGFELEISSSNFAKIIDCTTIENGEIKMECVWGRDKAQNVLLPINSEPYEQAIVNTKRVKTRVPIKDINIGDIILLHSGLECEYVGAYNLVSTDEKSGRMSTTDLCNVKRKFCIKRIVDPTNVWNYNNIKKGDPVFEFYSDLSVSEIITKIQTPKQPPLKELNLFIEKDRYTLVYFITDKPVKRNNIEVIFQPVGKERVQEFYEKFRIPIFITRQYYAIKPAFGYTGARFQLVSINTTNVEKTKLVVISRGVQNYWDHSESMDLSVEEIHQINVKIGGEIYTPHIGV